jgi:hypothetical protein
MTRPQQRSTPPPPAVCAGQGHGIVITGAGQGHGIVITGAGQGHGIVITGAGRARTQAGLPVQPRVSETGIEARS